MSARRPPAGATPLPRRTGAWLPYWPQGPRWQPVVPYLVLLGVVLADLFTPQDVTLVPVLSVVPPLAAIGATTATPPLVAGAVAVLATFALGAYDSGVPAPAVIARLLSVAMISVVSWAALVASLRRASELERLTLVADTVQRVLLRPLPPRLDGVRIAARYVAALAGTRVGGDLYEAVRSPYGVRVVVGDVRGKGLAAVEAAMDVVGVFREAARDEPTLERIARRMDRSLTGRERPEEFVTAVLLGVPPDGGWVEILSCGHPPPLRLRNGAVSTLYSPNPSPPLGLLDLPGGQPPASYRADFAPDDLLLLYTDGVAEARDADGQFYPLAEELFALDPDDPDAVVDQVLAGVRAYAGPALDDDIALVALTKAGTGPRSP